MLRLSVEGSSFGSCCLFSSCSERGCLCTRLPVLTSVKWGVVHERLQELYEMRPEADEKKASEQSHRDFNWCLSLGVKLYSVVYNLAMSTVLNTQLAAKLLSPVLADTALCDYFKEKLGVIELVRASGELEPFYFTMPLLFVSSEKWIKNRVNRIMDECPFDNTEVKLKMFQEKLLELSVEVFAAEEAVTGGRVHVFLANFLSKRAPIQNILTVLVNLILLFSFEKGHCSLCQETFVSAQRLFVLCLCCVSTVLMLVFSRGASLSCTIRSCASLQSTVWSRRSGSLPG